MKVTWLIVLISWTISVTATPTKQVELLIETDGKEALRTAMIAHFNQHTRARSQIKQSLTLGDTVAVIEEAFSNDGERSQCALSIYQMKQDLIQSVTYYAATTCEKR